MVEVKIVEAAIGRSNAGGADDIGVFDDVVLCFFLQLLEFQLFLVR